MTTPIDKTHTDESNFIMQLRNVREQVHQLERLACQIAEDGRLHTPKGLMLGGFLGFNKPPFVAVDTGVIHVWASYHSVDTEGAALNDNLDYIYGGADGDILILKAEDHNRAVRLVDAAGNLQLDGAANFTLDTENDRIVLQYDDSNQVWCELFRSSNQV